MREGERVRTWHGGYGRASHDWVIEGGNNSEVFVGSKRKNSVMYSCDSFTGLLAAQTLPHHLIVQYEKSLSNILLLPASLSGAAHCHCGVNTIGTPPS